MNQIVFDKAAKYLQQYGWVQYTNKGLKGSPNGCCLLQAICRVTSGQDDPKIRENALKEIQERINTPFIGLWNDSPERKLDEVMAVLRGRIA